MNSTSDNRTDGRALRRAYFREVNDRISESARHLRERRTEFVCECPDLDCRTRITMPLSTYDEIRRARTRFFVVAAHRDREAEEVVSRRRGYVVVEEVSGGR